MSQFPKTIDSSITDAHAHALAEREPVFFPVRAFCDDRGWSLMNLLQGVLRPEGQVNFSHQYPGIIKAWHRHKHQTDFWMCTQGHVKAGIHREDDGRSWSAVIGHMKPGIVVVPPTLWHGAATVGDQPAGLLYYVTHAYNPREPDEERRAYDSIDGFNWEPEHK